MVNPNNEDERSRARAEAMLRELDSNDIDRPRPGCWRVRGGEIWVLYLSDAGPGNREVGQPPEPALELIRPFEDLGFSGEVTPDTAAHYLRAMSETTHLRFARRAHPDASGRLALVAVATLYLEDLDLHELEATTAELAGWDA